MTMRAVPSDDQMRRRSPSPVRHNIIDWDHHHSGGKTPPYHRSNFFKVTKSESEKIAAIEAEKDYKSGLCRSSYASACDEAHSTYLNMKKKESSRLDASGNFNLSACLQRQNASMNADFMAPITYEVRAVTTDPKSPPSHATSSTIKRSPSRVRSVSPVRRAPTSPPCLRPHSPVQSHHECSPPIGQPQSLPQLRPTSPVSRRSQSQSPPRLHCNSTPHVPRQARPQSPKPLDRTHSPPQLHATTSVRSTSPSRTDTIFTSKYLTSALCQKYTPSPSPERIHYHSAQLQRSQSPAHSRAHAPVEVRAQSPPPPLRPQSPVAPVRQASSDSLDHTDVGNHSRSPTQHRVPALNKGRTFSSRRMAAPTNAHSASPSPSKQSIDIPKPEETDIIRSISQRIGSEVPQTPSQQRRKLIYESALLLDTNPLPDDFHGDFKYLERLLTEAGDGSIEVRRLKTVMRTIMESRKESLQLLQSAISTTTSA